MTRERREEVVLVALVVSVALHAGLMLLVRPKVMTHITPVERTVRRAPMHVIREALGPDPVSVADVADLAAKKDAPAVASASVAPAAEAPTSLSVGTISLIATPQHRWARQVSLVHRLPLPASDHL